MYKHYSIKYTYTKSPKFSLYFVKKKALNIFCKESRQDFYSAKRLLEKCFFVLNSSRSQFKGKLDNSIYFYGHLTFPFKVLYFSKVSCKDSITNNYLCIHCGSCNLL